MKIGKDRMMAMHFLMVADKIKYDDTIASYKNMYLMKKRNNYPETLHDSFVIMKVWTTTVNQSPHKFGFEFNTMGHDGNNTHGEVNMAKGQEKYNGIACTRCWSDNHPVSKCFATKHANGTVLNAEGEVMINEGDNDNDEIEVSSLC